MEAVTRRKRFKREQHDRVVHLTERDVSILKALNLHGPLTTPFLNYYHGADYSYTLKRLRLHFDNNLAGRNGPALHRPSAQRATENALGKYMTTDLSPVGIDYLRQRGDWEDAIRPSGSFPHMLMTSTVTASIEIGALKRGIEYIPGHVILERSGASLGAEVRGAKLIPDQLFALKYPDGSYRAFAVECDRGTEPITGQNRKSYERSYRQYEAFVGKKLYKQHYGLKCGLLVLNVMNSPSRLLSYTNIIPDCAYMLFTHVNGFGDFLTPPPVLNLSTWSRRGFPDFDIYDY